MKQIILHIVCEGQTEESFVKKVLQPYLRSYGIVAKPILVTTSRSKRAQGGIVNFSHIERDIQDTLKLWSSNNYEHHVVTTFIDYYALPNDFPRFSEAQKYFEPYQRVECLEQALGERIHSSRFLPYIQLHEFETLVLCGYQYLAAYYPDCKGLEEKLKKEFISQENPEFIDGGATTAPSKRILKLLESTYKKKYNKPFMGAYVTAQVGIERLRELCFHFNQWVAQIITLADTTRG